MNYPNRKYPRLKEYDYRTAAAYFVTICASDMRCIFGTIDALGNHRLSPFGEAALDEIHVLPGRFAYVEIDHAVVMPNHIHLLLQITDDLPLADRSSLPIIIGAFKSLVTRACRLRGLEDAHVFQRSFHEHVVRNETDYEEIWTYIENNPRKWALDRYFTE